MGSNANIRDDNGYIPLYYAIKNEDIEMINMVITHTNRDNINSEYDNKYLLYTAIKRKNTKIVEILLEFRADTNSVDKTGGIILQFVIENSNKEIVKTITNGI